MCQWWLVHPWHESWIISSTVLAGLVAFWRAHAGNLTQMERTLCLTWYVFLSWITGLGILYYGWAGPTLIWAITLLGLVIGLSRAKAKNYDGESRFLCLVISIIGVWFPVFIIGGIVIPNLLRCRGCHGESASVGACKTYAEAQDIYRRTDWDGDEVLEYATYVSGDYSLYEKTAGVGDIALVDASFAKASMTNIASTSPKAGYLFKVLYGQGPEAPGGRKSYIDASGNMTLGYALVAWPATWDGTGRNSFIINNTGTVYQQDLGPNTANIVSVMTEYNPDSLWVVAE